MNDNILVVLQAKLREHMNDFADSMAGGSCQNFPEYTKSVGIIHGLALAERELLDLVELERKSDED